MSIRVTVATVCYNSAATIENTIRSVLSQDYEDLEYLIVDGASADETMDIVRRFGDDKRMIVLSEPDRGLYDAMNKAHGMATGDYILYMNSGDVFADSSVLTDVADTLDGVNELVYGNVIRIKPYGRITEKYPGRYKPLMLLAQGRMMCHQSIFTRCDIMREYGFDTGYSITADYDFLMRMVRDKRRLKYIDRDISIVDNVEGISSSVRNMDTMRAQDDKSFKNCFPVLYALTCPGKALIRAVRRINERKQTADIKDAK